MKNSDLIQTKLVKELGPDVIKRIADLKDDDRSSYLEPIVFYFHQKHRIGCGSNGYAFNGEVIPIPDDYNNWQVFNSDSWELWCKFDERAFRNGEYDDVLEKYKTDVAVEYKLYFDGTETIEEVMEIIKQHPSYGHFRGIKQLHGWTYELEWGT